jgi:hypothetical protein
MKTKKEIINYLTQNQSRFKSKYNVKKIGLFGSALKTQDYKDIDILVDMENPDFDSYMDLKFELENAFNCPVDLVILDNVKKRLAPQIKKEVVYV